MEEWKPSSDPLSGGEKGWNTFADTEFLLSNAINITPISKPRKSGDLFGTSLEPGIEPSHSHLTKQLDDILAFFTLSLSYANIKVDM